MPNEIPFSLYILYSEKIDRYYIGISNNPESRVKYHNKSKKGWTIRGRPWKLVFVKQFSSRKEAGRWEKWLKSQKNRSLIKKIISGNFVFK